MRYLLLIYTAQRPDDWEEEAAQAEMDAYYAFMGEMGSRGLLQGGEALQATTSATTVRTRDGEVLTTDGPFAETKEQLGGYFLVDCKDLDEAIEVASKIPSATHGSIEVRPILELPSEPQG
ncbi:MAG: YciI family protein [Actinomycetota bacterium]